MVQGLARPERVPGIQVELEAEAMRRAAKVDLNQPDIVSAFRKMGASVAITSALGKGFPDLVVGLDGVSVLVEVKNGALSPSARQLTPDESRFHEGWRGWVEKVETIDEALSLCVRMRHHAEAQKLREKVKPQSFPIGEASERP